MSISATQNTPKRKDSEGHAEHTRSGGTLVIITLMIGLLIGMGASLFYTWRVSPRVLTDTRPDQLSTTARIDYLIALSLAYAADQRLEAAASRLSDMNASWQEIADAACDLSRGGYASTNTGQLAIRAMVRLAESQGVRNCASSFIPAPTALPTDIPTEQPPTATRVPPPTKTAVPTLGVTYTPEPELPTPTPVPVGEYAVNVISFCDPNASGVLEIFVQAPDSAGLPAVAVEISDGINRDTIYTGLKPDRDPGYVDYEMGEDTEYTVGLRDARATERTRPLSAIACNVPNGGTARAGFRIFFKRVLE